MVVACAANLLIAAAKGTAAMLTGSAALLAETTHSIAGTGNELLLYVGVRQSARSADERYPLGYGQARYFWSLLSADGAELAANVERLRQRPLAVLAVARAEITPSPHRSEITPPG